MYEKLKDFQSVIVSILVCITIVLVAINTSDVIKKEEISVTGAAYKIVKSDIGILRIEIKASNSIKSNAYNIIQKQIPIVKNYIKAQGFIDSEITLLTPNNYPTYIYDSKTGFSTNQIDKYNFTQAIQVKSENVDKIKALALEAQTLLSQNIDLNVNTPKYYYSKLGEIKVELLKEASLDAKLRAQGMLSATKNSVGKIHSVRMGVFQITPPDSNDVSDLGMNDTSSIDKKVTAVANVIFGIK